MQDHSSNPRLLWVGWDFSDWLLLDPLLDNGDLPNLERLVDSGIRARTTPARPLSRPALWTSATAALKAYQHGIVTELEPDGAGGVQPIGDESRPFKTIWSDLDEKGLSTISIGWPLSDTQDSRLGIKVPESWGLSRPGRELSSISPNRLQQVVDDLHVAPDELPPGVMDLLLESVANKDLIPSSIQTELENALAATASFHNVATWAIEHQAWDLLAVAYPFAGETSRAVLAWRQVIDELDEHGVSQTLQIIQRNAWKLQDMMLGRLLDLIPNDVTVLLFSTCGYYCGPMNGMSEEMGNMILPTIKHRLAKKKRVRREGVFIFANPNEPDECLVDEIELDQLPRMVADFLDTEFSPVPMQNAQQSSGTKLDSCWNKQALLEDLQSLGFITPSPSSVALEELARKRGLALAESAMEDGQFEIALGYLRESWQRVEQLETQTLIVSCLTALNRKTEAARELQKLKDFDASRLATLAQEVRWQAAFGSLVDAKRCLDQVLERPDGNCIARQMGFTSLHLKLWDYATRFLEMAVAKNPEDGLVRNALGNALLKSGQVSEAVKQHRIAVSLMPNISLAHLNLAEALYAAGQLEKAQKAVHAAKLMQLNSSQLSSLPVTETTGTAT